VKLLNQTAEDKEPRSNGGNELHFAMTVSPDSALAGEPLLIDCKTASALLGVGISTFYAMDRSGELGPPGLRLRRRRLWPREELVAWVQAGCPPRPQWLASR